MAYVTKDDLHTKYQGGHGNLFELTSFTTNSKPYFCIVDYHGKFPVVKQVEGISADILMKTCKIIFLEYGLYSKDVSDTGTTFISGKFEIFCKKTWPSICSFIIIKPPEQWSAEVHIQFVKRTMKKFYETNADLHIPLLQISSTPITLDYQAWPCFCLIDHLEAYCQGSIDHPLCMKMIRVTMLH